MSHKRKEIRCAIADLLKGKTVAGDSVYPGRSEVIFNKARPIIMVYCRPEPSEPMTDQDHSSIRKPTVAIQAMVDDPSDGPDSAVTLDDAMDDIAKEIENCMAADPTLGGLISKSALTATDPEVSADGERLIGGVRLTYDITYSA